MDRTYPPSSSPSSIAFPLFFSIVIVTPKPDLCASDTNSVMSVDLSLPRSSSPIINPYKDAPGLLLPFSLYIHVDLDSPDELANIEKECNRQIPGCTGVERAPRHDMRGRPLRAALDEHLNNVISKRHFEPFYFVAVTNQDWRDKGVLLVAMDDGSDDEVSCVDQMRVSAAEAGLFLVNLQIGNTDWSEYKEQKDDDNYCLGDDEDPSDDRSQLYDRPQTDEEYSDGASSITPNVGYWIGLYAIPGVPYETVMRGLEPSWGPPRPSSELMCRPQGRISAVGRDDIVAECARLHPMRC